MHYLDLLPPTGLACLVVADARDKPTGAPQLIDVALPDARARFDAIIAGAVKHRRSVFTSYYTLLDRGRLATGSRDNAGADALHQCLIVDVDVDPTKPECFATADDMIQSLMKLEELLPITACVSSGGGAHLYWRMETALPHDKRNKAQQALRGFLHNLDPRLVADPRRMKDAGVLRPTNSTNFKPQYGPDGNPVEFWWDTGPTYPTKDLIARCANITPNTTLHPEDTALATTLATTPQTNTAATLTENEGRFQRGSYPIKDIAAKCELFRTYTLDHMRSTQGARQIATRNDGAAWEAILQLGAFMERPEQTVYAYAQAQAYATPDDEKTIHTRMAGWRAPPSCRRMRELLLGQAPEVAGVASNCAICARCPLTLLNDKINNTPLDAVDYDKRAALVRSVGEQNAALFTAPAQVSGQAWLDADELNRLASVDYNKTMCPPSPAVGDAVSITDEGVTCLKVTGKQAVRVQGFSCPEIPVIESNADNSVLYVIARLAPGQETPVGLQQTPRAMLPPTVCRPVMTREAYRAAMASRMVSTQEEFSRVFNAASRMGESIGRSETACAADGATRTLPACRVDDSGGICKVLWASEPMLIVSPGFKGTFAEHRDRLQWMFDHATAPTALAMMATFISPMMHLVPGDGDTPVISISGDSGKGKSLVAQCMGGVWDTSGTSVTYSAMQAGMTPNALQAVVQATGALPLYADELRLDDNQLAQTLMGVASGKVKTRMRADTTVSGGTAKTGRSGILVMLNNLTDLYTRIYKAAGPSMAGAAMNRVLHLNTGSDYLFTAPPPSDLVPSAGPRGVFGVNYARLLAWRHAEVVAELATIPGLSRTAPSSQRFDLVVQVATKVACRLLTEMGLRVDTVYARVMEALTAVEAARKAATRLGATYVFDGVKYASVKLSLSETVGQLNNSVSWTMALSGANGKITSIEVRHLSGVVQTFVSDEAFHDYARQSRTVDAASAKESVVTHFAQSASVPKDAFMRKFNLGDGTTARMVGAYYELTETGASPLQV